MDRREFLTAQRKPAVQPFTVSPTSLPSVAGGLTPYSGAWTSAEVVHLLKRTMFGSAKADIDYFKSKTMAEAVDELLNPAAPLPAPPVKEYDPTGAATPDTNIAPGTTWVNDPSTDSTIHSRRNASFKKWWTGVMLSQDRSIMEKMTLFWSNHFSTLVRMISNSQYVYKHHDLLRTYSLGNFKTLIKAVTIDPGMLVSLNGKDNSVSGPNENYARELQELFTLGKENIPGYTENDVKAAAKVLTGWQVNANTVSSTFTVSRHDKTNKQFSSFYNNTVITGRSSATAGDQEIDDLLNMIFNKKAEVSNFIVKKLYRWFCYYTITDEVQANVINPLADIFQQSNWEIRPVLAALFKSEHFYDAAVRGCMIKSPVDFVTGLFREFNVGFPDPVNAYADAYIMWEYMRSTYVSPMNQNIGDPLDVSGWPAYYQIPQYYELWINSSTLPLRNKFAESFLGSGYTRNGFTVKIDPVAFARALPNPDNPNLLIMDSLEILYAVPLSATAQQTIKQQILLTGQANDQYWKDAWDAYKNTNYNNNSTQYKTVQTRLVNLYKYLLLNLAEYQLH